MRSLLLAGSCLALAIATTAEAKPKAAIDVPAFHTVPMGIVPPTPKGKLTGAVTPTAYRLDLTVDPAQPRFSGHVEIDATLNATSRYVHLHGRELNVTKATATIAGRTLT